MEMERHPTLTIYVFIYIYIYIKSKTIGEQYNHNYKLGQLRTHIKLFIFGNIFSRIEKIVNTFLISKKFFSKNENYCNEQNPYK